MVIGAKEKLAANFTLFLGCFLAGLSTGFLLSSDSGASEEGPGGTGAAAGAHDELGSEGSFSFFTGTGISMFSSWFKIIISTNTEKQNTFSSRTHKKCLFSVFPLNLSKNTFRTHKCHT